MYPCINSVCSVGSVGYGYQYYGTVGKPELEIKTKDLRILKFTFNDITERNEANQEIEKRAFWEKYNLKMQDVVFAFEYKKHIPIPDYSEIKSYLYDAKQEFIRQGLNGHEFMISDINKNYELCPSYPRELLFPTCLDPPVIKESALFRSFNRLPTVCWVHPINKATVSRCSQPLTGLSGHGCKGDEAVVISLYQVCKSLEQFTNESHSMIYDSTIENPVRLYIVDARSKIAAKCNWAVGGGYEKEDRYPGCALKFMDIYNIHEMRKSFRAVTKLCQDPSNQDRRLFEQTLWLDHTKTVLKSSKKLARFVEQGKSILVHCSDGWDRTSQIVALTEFLLDPYYRTICGFGILIQKEWLAFGHKFKNRLGHGQPEDYSQEQSPIFIQFMDCVYQLLMQYPNWFEFNEEYLITILDNLYSGRFGTFLADSEREKEQENIRETTLSIWPWLMSPENIVRFKNPEYFPYSEPIYPKCATLHLHVWTGYYERYKLSMVQHHEHQQRSLQRNLSRTELRVENQKLREEIEITSQKINNYEHILKNIIQKDLFLQETLKDIDSSKPLELVLSCTPQGIRCLINHPENRGSPMITRKVNDLTASLQENYVPICNSQNVSDIISRSKSEDDIFMDSFLSISSPVEDESKQDKLLSESVSSRNIVRLLIPSCGAILTVSLGKIMNWIKSTR
jgi:myotubularin-related protein 1/2